MSETITIEEYRALQKAPQKYGNRKIEVDGVRFDSRKEANRYQELLLLEAGGAIEDLTPHPRYELQPAFRDARGWKHPAITYVADFSYLEINDPSAVVGTLVVEDVKGGKGTQTEVFRIKAKLFRFRYPNIELRIIEL